MALALLLSTSASALLSQPVSSLPTGRAHATGRFEGRYARTSLICCSADSYSSTTRSVALGAERADAHLAKFDRRGLLWGASTAAVLSLNVLPANAAGFSQETIAAKLSRVPLFIITNKQDAPYLTEFDQVNGRRGGSFFLDPRDAIETYKDVKSFDPAASLSVVPLDSVWFELPKSEAEAAAAPQPKAGTSTDLRLFKIRPISSETDEANKILKSDGSEPLKAGAVPIFFSSSILFDVDGQKQLPYFFRLEDLKASIAQLDSAPSERIKVATLESLVARMSKEKLNPSPLLVAAAPAAAVVERMGLGTTDMGPGSNVRAPPTDPLEALVLQAPFGDNRK